MSTEFPSKNGIARKWHVIDAQDVVLGKLASKAAMLLMGKTKPIYTPFLDTGDHVIVINAGKVRLTGRKEEQKFIAISPAIRADWWKQSLGRVRAKSPLALWKTPFRHASQDQARQTDVPEAQGVRGRPASSRGAEAGRADGEIAA